MKKAYFAPLCEVVALHDEDVITTSGGFTGSEYEAEYGEGEGNLPSMSL